MDEKKREYDFYSDGMKIFLDYISRQLEKNPEYKLHPIIRAFECGIEGLKTAKDGENVLGLSNPYVVVLEKRSDGIGVKSIRNLKVEKELSFESLIVMFRLQIYLDRIDSDTLSVDQAANALNEVIPGNNFYVLGDEWTVARDNFFSALENGKVCFSEDSKGIEEISNISKDTPWEEYSQRLRAFIGPFIGKKNKIVLTTPKNLKVEKFKIFDLAIEFLLGKASEFFNSMRQANN